MKPFCISFLVLFIFIKSTAQTPTHKQADKGNETLIFVEQQPQYPGGDGQMWKFIQQHLNYPKEAITDSIEGKVIVRFAVDTDGQVTDVSLIKTTNHIFDKEVLRVIKLLPKFKPGYTGGKPVKVYFNYPFNFKLT